MKNTETEIEQSADKLKTSLPENRHSKFSNAEWRTKQLVALAEVLKESLTPESLAMYVESLADLSDDQIRRGVGRAVRELEWFPKPAKLRELAGAEGSVIDQDARAREAWDSMIHFVDKYVGNDVYGNFGPEHGWYPKTFPDPGQKISDTVRRTGGWRTYKCMSKEDFPFTQKRFLEEYAAWPAVAQISSTKLLPQITRLQLVSKPMATSKVSVPETEPTEVPLLKAKPITVPMTDAELCDRRKLLRQQAELLARSSSKNPVRQAAVGSSAANCGSEQKTGSESK